MNYTNALKRLRTWADQVEGGEVSARSIWEKHNQPKRGIMTRLRTKEQQETKALGDEMFLELRKFNRMLKGQEENGTQ